MPAGDANRTWFPEMVAMLRSQWSSGLNFDQLVDLRAKLDSMLHRIRSERHIRPPVIRCRRCGRIGEAAKPDVTVRGMILSLGRFGIAPAEEVRTLEKLWTAHRRQNGLDLNGNAVEAESASIQPCGHSGAVGR